MSAPIAVSVQLAVYAWLTTGVLGSFLTDHLEDRYLDPLQIAKRAIVEVVLGPVTLIRSFR